MVNNTHSDHILPNLSLISLRSLPHFLLQNQFALTNTKSSPHPKIPGLAQCEQQCTRLAGRNFQLATPNSMEEYTCLIHKAGGDGVPIWTGFEVLGNKIMSRYVPGEQFKSYGWGKARWGPSPEPQRNGECSCRFGKRRSGNESEGDLSLQGVLHQRKYKHRTAGLREGWEQDNQMCMCTRWAVIRFSWNSMIFRSSRSSKAGSFLFQQHAHANISSFFFFAECWHATCTVKQLKGKFAP